MLFQWVSKVPVTLPHSIILFLLFAMYMFPNYGLYQLVGEFSSKAFAGSTWYFWQITERGNRNYNLLDYVN
jgi:hypothetical protein